VAPAKAGLGWNDQNGPSNRQLAHSTPIMYLGTRIPTCRSPRQSFMQTLRVAALCCLAAWGVGLSSSALASPQTSNSLQLLIAEVLARHPQLAVQGAAVRAAEAGLDGAQWQFYPTPSVSVENASASAGDTSYGGDRQVAILGLRQPLWNGGRLSANLEKAQATLTLNNALLAESRQQLILRVIQSYGDWLAAYEKQKVFATGLSLHQQMKEMVVRRVQEGQSAPNDLVLAEERLAMLEADAMATSTQKLTALLKLSQLAGRSINEQEITLRPAASIAPVATLEFLLGQAQESSPTLARYRAIAQTQRSALAERKADQWPEVYGRVERQFGNFSASGQAPETRAFIGLTSRFGAGLSNRSAIAEAQGQLDAALAEIDVQLLGLQEQIMVDHAVLVQSEPRRLALQLGVSKSKLVLQSWDRQFLSGRKTWQDLMNSAREHIQLEAQIADLEASRLVAFWRLKALTDSAQLLNLP